MSKGWKVVIGILVVLVLALSAVVGYVVISGQTGIVLPIPGVASQPGFIGTWVTHFGGIFGDATVRLDSDGTGFFRNAVKFTWQRTENGFVAQIETRENGPLQTCTFSGQVSNDGQKMLVTGWGLYGFKPNDSTTFEKI